jgi:hypothetical protein
VLQIEEMHYNNFDVYHYIHKNENLEKQFVGLKEFIVKTKCYYLIKFEQVYGTLTVFDDHMTFEPDVQAKENSNLIQEDSAHLLQYRKLDDYKCMIHYLDIIDCPIMTLVNEEALMSPNTFI